MRWSILLIACFALPVFCGAQSNVTDVSIKIKQLQEIGVDTVVCFYYKYMESWPVGKDTCIPHDIKYLLWKRNSKCWIQKFDNCGENEPKQDNRDVINIVERNFKRIRYEQIKPIQSPTCIIETVSDGGYAILEMYADSKIITKEMYLDDLNAKYVFHQRNINYAHNHNTLIYKLKAIIDSEIKMLN